MPYSEILIKPMREDLTRLGVEETRTPEQVETGYQARRRARCSSSSTRSAAAPRARRAPASRWRSRTRRSPTAPSPSSPAPTSRQRTRRASTSRPTRPRRPRSVSSKTASSSSCSNATRSRTSSPSRSPTNSPKPSTALHTRRRGHGVREGFWVLGFGCCGSSATSAPALQNPEPFILPRCLSHSTRPSCTCREQGISRLGARRRGGSRWRWRTSRVKRTRARRRSKTC